MSRRDPQPQPPQPGSPWPDPDPQPDGGWPRPTTWPMWLLALAPGLAALAGWAGGWLLTVVIPA